jgi:nitrite reductase/ring-hydroxylating ferredoxin subunit
MSRRTHVCSLEELSPGEMKLVPVGKFGVGVYNVKGRLHAITNYCAHEGAPLCEGYTVGMNAVDAHTRRGVTPQSGGAIGGGAGAPRG